MARDIQFSVPNVLKITAMAALGTFGLKLLADATGVGKGLTRFLP